MNKIESKKSILTYQQGIPVLKLYGSYYDMGYQYGLLLKDKIVEIMNEIDKVEDFYAPFINPLLRPFMRLYFKYIFISSKKDVPKKYNQELRGISKATGIPVYKFLRLIFFPDFLTKLECTSIVGNTKDGILLGRNLDFFPPTLGRYPIIVEYNPDEGTRYTLIAYIGLLGALTGMNNSGVSISLNMCSIIQPNNKPSMHVGYMLRELLNKAQSLQDINKLLENYTSYQGWIVTVSSKNGNQGAIYDIAGKDICKHELNNKPYLYAVNHFLNKDYNKRCRSIQNTGKEYNVNRIDFLEKNIKKIRNEDSLIDILSSSDFYIYNNMIGRFTVNNYQTLQTVIINPLTNEFIFSSHPGYAGWSKFYRYSLDSNEITLYKDEDKRITLSDNHVKWLDNMFSDPIETLKNTNYDELNMHQFEMIFDLYDLRKDILELENIIEPLQRKSQEYPDYSFPLLLLGKVKFYLKQYPDAIEYFNKSINAQINFNYDMMICNKLMAQSYLELGDARRACSCANEAKRLLDLFAHNSKDERFNKELLRIISKTKKVT